MRTLQLPLGDGATRFFVDNGTKIRFMGRERREDKTTNQKIAASYRGAAPEEATLEQRGDLGGGHARNDLNTRDGATIREGGGKREQPTPDCVQQVGGP